MAYISKIVLSAIQVDGMNSAPFHLIFSVIKAVWRFCVDVVASAEPQEDEPSLHDSDLHGVYNYRTSRHDAGTDPFGWYEQDWSD